jgi:hypothetical protein
LVKLEFFNTQLCGKIVKTLKTGFKNDFVN